MAAVQLNLQVVSSQVAYPRVSEILNCIDAGKLLDRLEKYRAKGGRKTYQIESLWRAYLLTFLLDLSNINELIRRLSNDPKLMRLCGFSKLPARRTFNRFVARLSSHQDLVEECLADLVTQFKALKPDLGENVAVDSTAVRTHSNDNKKSKVTGQVSDLDATRGVRTSARNPKKTESYFGYKLHLIADTKYEIPLTGFVTPANCSDSPELPRLLDRAKDQFPWFKPKAVMADRGYDSTKNHEAVLNKDSAFICPMRRWPGNRRYGIYDRHGTPTCEGGERMEYLMTDPDKGHLYKCPNWGCRVKMDSMLTTCTVFVYVDWRTEPNKRIHGPVKRNSPEWQRLYRQRYSVERVFKSMKEFRRLERHYVRGLAKISLHASMSVLAYTATVLVQTQAQSEIPRWMVERVA